MAGLITAALILPVFCFRHYIQDGSKFPDYMLDDLGMKTTDLRAKKAGILPYATLVAGLIVVLISNRIFVL